MVHSRCTWSFHSTLEHNRKALSVGRSYLLASKKQSLFFRLDIEFILDKFLKVFEHRCSGCRYYEQHAGVHHPHSHVHGCGGRARSRVSMAVACERLKNHDRLIERRHGYRYVSNGHRRHENVIKTSDTVLTASRYDNTVWFTHPRRNNRRNRVHDRRLGQPRSRRVYPVFWPVTPRFLSVYVTNDGEDDQGRNPMGNGRTIATRRRRPGKTRTNSTERIAHKYTNAQNAVRQTIDNTFFWRDQRRRALV